MADVERISFSVPPGLPLTGVDELRTSHRGAIESAIAEELDRYPAAVSIPPLIVVAAAEFEGQRVRTRFFADSGVGVLTPQLDFRGDVHRVIAASLLAQHPEHARALRDSWSEDQALNLYSGALDDEAEIIAMVAALMTNRTTLRDLARTESGFGLRVQAAEAFMMSVGVGVHARAAAGPSPAAFLTEITGTFPHYLAQPGNVSVDLTPPTGRVGEKYTFTPVEFSSADDIVEGLARDLWVYPEGLLSDVAEKVCMVDDVRHPRHNISGFASTPEGGLATVVVQTNNRRRILFHELGHSVHFRHAGSFPDEAWDEIAPSDEYFGSAHDFIDLGVFIDDFHPSLLQRGFITSYATSHKKEDIAELMEAIFFGDLRLWASLADSHVLAQKVDLLVGFLGDVHPVLTREFLESLSSLRHGQEAAWSK